MPSSTPNQKQNNAATPNKSLSASAREFVPTKLSVNAPSFVPNFHAPSFVPTMMPQMMYSPTMNRAPIMTSPIMHGSPMMMNVPSPSHSPFMAPRYGSPSQVPSAPFSIGESAGPAATPEPSQSQPSCSFRGPTPSQSRETVTSSSGEVKQVEDDKDASTTAPETPTNDVTDEAVSVEVTEEPDATAMPDDKRPVNTLLTATETPVAVPDTIDTMVVIPEGKPLKVSELPLTSEESEKVSDAIAAAEEATTAEQGAPAGVEEPTEETFAANIPADGRYTIEFLLSMKDMFREMPKDVDATLACFGRGRSNSRSNYDGRRSSRSGAYNHRNDRRRGSQFERSNSFTNNGRREYQPARGGKGDGVHDDNFSRSSFGTQMGKVENQRHGRKGHSRRNSRTRSCSPDLFGPVAPLEMSENRYVVKKDVEGEQKIVRKLQAILNKLTPEKFDRLNSQLIDLIVEGLEYLDAIVTLLFDKALSEFTFSSMYADLCLSLSQNLGSDENAEAFRKRILTTCQIAFQQRPEISSFDELPEEEREEKQSKARRRRKGIVTFIANLYLKGLLKSEIMLRCLVALLGSVDDPVPCNIEDACTMMTVMGKSLDALRDNRTTSFMKAAFHMFQQLASNKKLESRIRFGIRDLIDLRADRWDPRREAVVATTLAEVHAKAKKELEEKERQSRAHRDRDNRDRRGYNGRGYGHDRSPSRGRSHNYGGSMGRPVLHRRPSMPVTSDGWNHVVKNSRSASVSGSHVGVATNGNHGRRMSQDVRRASMSMPTTPKKRSNSTVSRRGSMQKNQSPPAPHRNAFMALDDDEASDNESDGACSSTESAEERKVVEAPKPVVDEKQLRSKIRMLVKEFFSIGDFNEAHECLLELSSDTLHHEIVTEAFSIALEGKDRARELCPKLLDDLVKRGDLNQSHFERGLRELCEIVPDIVFDIPKLYEYLPAMFAGIISSGTLPLQTLQTSVVKVIADSDTKKATKLFLDTLSQTRSLQSDEFVLKSIEDAKLRLSSCVHLNEDELRENLRDRELDALSTCI